MKRLELKAYAKINLALDVTGRREDGYHLVDMVMNQIGLWDTVQLETEERPAERGFAITLTVEGAALSCGADNLAWKAAEAMGQIWKEKNGSEAPSVSIRIVKRIPVAAGLAGGSADCAAVLLGLNALWDLRLDLENLKAAGLSLGADVPFCVSGQAFGNPFLGLSGGSPGARAKGVGEKLTPLPQPDFWILLVKPAFSVSTGEIYRALDETPEYEHPDIEQMICGLQEKDWEKVFRNAGNVLEKSVEIRYPDIKYTKSKINTIGNPVYTAMSGSGPTLFGLFDSEESCRQAARKLSEEDGQVITVPFL